jgi:large subunit ribosomal protein L23
MGLLYRLKIKRRAQKVKKEKLLKKFDPTEIILSPVQTEKAGPYGEKILTVKVKKPVYDKDGNKKRDEKGNVITEIEERQIAKYTFIVSRNANKNDIKKAISMIYGIPEEDIEKVNTMRVPPKYRAYRGLVRKPYKKAIITLKPGKRLKIMDVA